MRTTTLNKMHFQNAPTGQKSTVAQAFWNSEVEMELREQGWEDYRFAKQEDRESWWK